MGPVVVGIQEGQPEAVLREAIAIARAMNAPLVGAHVRPPAPVLSDGLSVVDAAPDPAVDLEEARALQLRLAERMREVTCDDGPPWSIELLFGDPAGELGRLGERVGAVMIVVGTREAGVGRAVGEFFGGSIAVHLAHRQHRPVLVVPVHPVITPDELPWHAGQQGPPAVD